MRLFRIARSDPPTLDDFRSAWDQGRRPARQEDERTYKAVSTFTSFAAAADRAERFDLGDFVAELEVPGEPSMTVRGEHVALHDLAPEHLLLYVVATQPRTR